MALQYATAIVDPPKPYPTVPLGGAGKKWPAGEVKALLAALCKQVIERDSDALIEASYAEGLQAGTLSVRDVVFSLAMSEAYRDKYACPGNPGEAVKHAYRRLLAREGEPGGVAYWTPICQSPGLTVVLHGHVTSAEYMNRFGVDKVPAASLQAAPPPQPKPAPPAAKAAPLPQVKLAGVVHVQDLGDQPLKNNDWNGTKGQKRRLEAFELGIVPKVEGLSLQYMAHEEGPGDTPWLDSPKLAGTRGQKRRLEGFAVRLAGPNASKYDVCYQGHLQDKGDTAVAKNGEFCGTRGQSRRLEAIKVWVQAK